MKIKPKPKKQTKESTYNKRTNNWRITFASHIIDSMLVLEIENTD